MYFKLRPNKALWSHAQNEIPDNGQLYYWRKTLGLLRTISDFLLGFLILMGISLRKKGSREYGDPSAYEKL